MMAVLHNTNSKYSLPIQFQLLVSPTAIQSVWSCHVPCQCGWKGDESCHVCHEEVNSQTKNILIVNLQDDCANYCD